MFNYYISFVTYQVRIVYNNLYEITFRCLYLKYWRHQRFLKFHLVTNSIKGITNFIKTPDNQTSSSIKSNKTNQDPATNITSNLITTTHH